MLDPRDIQRGGDNRSDGVEFVGYHCVRREVAGDPQQLVVGQVDSDVPEECGR
jgi:hypothetical protein